MSKTTTKEKATKAKVIENTGKSWLQAEQRYLLSRLEEKTDGWSTWESKKQLADFCADMGEPEEKAVPQGLGDIVRSGYIRLTVSRAEMSKYTCVATIQARAAEILGNKITDFYTTIEKGQKLR